ncbi:class I SAM-dependent methyltransferase [Blautia pseudococcoides]|uniref:class I SAM-dependent methyltransferase n=1 Tax=Blautia pseudococcoides TaxID=1796616 RepID=UPI00148B035A|nr:class I SAM-dependent methyltransferase [Blautia pseudococcoides]MCR2023327.1 class I SAM-dependent methyltransferase [Blautia pseudococcoides]QJU14304.1 class I SAM-dependent methyltransferase [Blautia pseudococcoides]
MKITYKILSKFYDLIDVFYFTSKGDNPRTAILNIIPNKNVKVLDMCCGTMSNGIRIAKKRKRAKVIGIDLSSNMLNIAKDKIRKDKVKNASIHKCDATNTEFENEKFDYVIIALVLHEIKMELANAMLKEAYRLLKNDGELIVLEWEKSSSIIKSIKFAPIKILEPKPFTSFFALDKKEYFSDNQFEIIQKYHCDYSCVYEMKKRVQ